MMAFLPIWCVLLFIISLAPTVAADTCSTIAAQTSIGVEYPLSLGYVTDLAGYWSTASAATQPTCILTPKTAEEVAAIMAVLATNDEIFATKSGGHNPNLNFSSVTGGPLINMKRLNEVVLDVPSKTVRVGPGNKWEDVAAALDGTGYTAVGGRIGDVGVGGYMLGGKKNFCCPLVDHWC
jgi:FAD/FMN-containing dehydrogenase